MSGADEQQRDTGGRRGWWLVGLLAVIGAAAGAFAGYRLDPDVRELVPSLAVAGFGLGGLIGLLLLAPVGLWRAWRRRARRRAAAPERADLPDGTGLWHTADPEREAAPAAAAELPGQAVVEAPTAEETEPERPEEPAPGPGRRRRRRSRRRSSPSRSAGRRRTLQRRSPGLSRRSPRRRRERSPAGTPTRGTACAATGTGTPGPGMSGVAAHGSARAKPAAAADADQASAVPARLAATRSVASPPSAAGSGQVAGLMHSAVGAS